MSNKKNLKQVNDSSNHKIDTLHYTTNKRNEITEIDPYDSLANELVDTTTLRGKRQWIKNHFLIDNGISVFDHDTLFDLTYDSFKDYLISYYGQVGSGIKNRIEVYLYDTKRKCYILNEQLSALPNPTFYIKQKKLTGFYIGSGGGGGSKLEWRKGKWTLTKEFEVDYGGDTTKWKISYPLRKKLEIKIRPYQMIPPKDILETNIKL
jgi:hypothetical protein